MTNLRRDLQSRRWARIGPLFALPWLVFMVIPIIQTAQHRPSLQENVSILLAAGFTAGYGWFWLAGFHAGPRRRTAGALALTALALFIVATRGSTWLGTGFFVPPLIAIGLPVWVSIPVEALAVLPVFGWGAIAASLDGSTVLAMELNSALLYVCMLGVRRLIQAIAELRTARAELAHLAVTAERERFARDLHDLLGHSLSVIALKSELAGRLLETDPGRAGAELRDIEAVSRRSLKEVREAVSGLRETSLLNEVAAARATLGAAGIACEWAPEIAEIPLGAETVLAWAVREGITNVIRHSQATRCRIRLYQDEGEVRLEMVDDGCCSPKPGRVEDGTGLRGLAERVRACNGRLLASPRSDGGFGLSVSIPLQPA